MTFFPWTSVLWPLWHGIHFGEAPLGSQPVWCAAGGPWERDDRVESLVQMTASNTLWKDVLEEEQRASWSCYAMGKPRCLSAEVLIKRKRGRLIGPLSASQEHGVCGDGGMELRATREQGLQIFLFYEIITNISGHNLIWISMCPQWLMDKKSLHWLTVDPADQLLMAPWMGNSAGASVHVHPASLRTAACRPWLTEILQPLFVILCCEGQQAQALPCWKFSWDRV